MKRIILTLTLALSLATSFVACQSTPQKGAVNTLTAVGETVNTAYEAYLESVVRGTVPTNDVPKVTGYFKDFQAAFRTAAAAAHFATNATLANPELMDVAAKLTTAVALIEGK